MKLPVALLMFILCGFFLNAMDWPAPEAKIARNFGLNDQGRPLLGESFDAKGNVFSADEGEIIFRSSEQDSARSIPNPLGDWVAVDHGDGLIGIYARGGDSPETEKQKKAGRDTILARAGKSGWTTGEGFYFSVYDRKEHCWVNPSMIIGSMQDTLPPSIISVKLRNENGQLFDLAQTRNIRQGRYGIEVEAADRGESTTAPVAPYRITCSLNGVEMGILALEIFFARDGTLMIYGDGLVPVSTIYSTYPALEAASGVWFTRGGASLEIIVEDHSKNTRTAAYRIFVE
ncbi:MAG: hypothetical protein LBV68_01005 [Spirochaetaceae bacterium]|jgi:hypothetical protein|nr:hypothetical protein [Spirochaetaceae bacterium]